jgi:hypothetical protein
MMLAPHQDARVRRYPGDPEIDLSHTNHLERVR